MCWLMENIAQLSELVTSLKKHQAQHEHMNDHMMQAKTNNAHQVSKLRGVISDENAVRSIYATRVNSSETLTWAGLGQRVVNLEGKMECARTQGRQDCM